MIDRARRIVVIGPMGHAEDVTIGELFDGIKQAVIVELRELVRTEVAAFSAASVPPGRPTRAAVSPPPPR